jgi:hypothetical protein
MYRTGAGSLLQLNSNVNFGNPDVIYAAGLYASGVNRKKKTVSASVSFSVNTNWLSAMGSRLTDFLERIDLKRNFL